LASVEGGVVGNPGSAEEVPPPPGLSSPGTGSSRLDTRGFLKDKDRDDDNEPTGVNAPALGVVLVELVATAAAVVVDSVRSVDEAESVVCLLRDGVRSNKGLIVRDGITGACAFSLAFVEEVLVNNG